MSAERAREGLTDDAALGGKLRLLQPRKGHRFGHDAVLLAAAVEARPGDRVVEFGAGVGLAGLAVAWRVPDAQVTLIDIEPGLVDLAEENARRNGMAERVRTLALDVGGPAAAFAAAGLSPGSADHVMMNPPFNREDARVSPDPDRARAHAGVPGLLPSWIGAAARLLAEGGGLTLIWRADGLNDVQVALAADFGGVSVTPVHPRPGAAAIRILVTAAKGGSAPPSILPELTLQDDRGRPSAQAERILRGGEPLRPLAAAPASRIA